MMIVTAHELRHIVLSLIVRVTAWLLVIPDTLFFLPAFPFSDYCLKRGKAQSAKDRPAKSKQELVQSEHDRHSFQIFHYALHRQRARSQVADQRQVLHIWCQP